MGFFGDIAGSLIGGLIGKSGEDKARRDFETDMSGAIRAASAIRTEPMGTSTLLGSTSPDLSFLLSPRAEGITRQMEDARNINFNALHDFNRRDFANRFFDSIDKLESGRERRAFADLESKLFNRAGVSTGTATQLAQFQNDIGDARQRRLMQANMASDQRQQNLFNQFLASINPEFALQTSQLNQLRTGIAGGQLNASGDAMTRQAIINAGAQGAGFGAQSTTNFFNSLGKNVGGAVSAGVSSLLAPNRSSGAGGGGGFFNPGAVNFNNAFTSGFNSLGF